MYQSTYTSNKKRQSRYKGIILLILVIGFLSISFLCLAVLKQKETTNLVGTWTSEETGVVLTFTKEGKVIFKDNLSQGIYRIISPNTIEYTVDNMSFEMLYTIEEGKLHWGINKENMETFSSSLLK